MTLKAWSDPERIRIAESKYRDYVPHPIHKDLCGHGRNNFVMSIHGCDIHKYWPWHLVAPRYSSFSPSEGPFTDENAEYCVRYGSGDGDYISSVKTLQCAIADAKIKSEEKKT